MIIPPFIMFIILPSLFFGLILFILFRKKILSFLFPQNWIEVEMLEIDNNVRNWLQKKNDNLSFEFNKGKYFMFTGDSKGKIPTIYRSGRLAKLYYIEGNQFPLDFRNIQLSGNAYLSRQLDNIKLSELWVDEDNVLENIFKKYGIVILGIILFILIIGMFK